VPAFLPNELPIQGRVRHHWIILLRHPHKVLGIALLIMLALLVLGPDPWLWLFILLLTIGIVMTFRVREWRAEQIILTQTRILRVRGLPETTATESSLRLDRISGAVVEQSVLGKFLGYASIELEAAGSHPDFRHLRNIEQPDRFYLQLRHIIFGEGTKAPPWTGDDDGRYPDEFETTPLPSTGERPVRRGRLGP
jgi:hypothetical protein